jgi:T5orf172 domain
MRTHSRVLAEPAVEPFLIDDEGSLVEGQSWFVYLFALMDCSAFKVGFSRNPLQRICTFSRRFFERFDLSQSLLLELAQCEQARMLEAEIKTMLAQHRIEAPTWVPAMAGGQTEWFSAVYFGDAAARLDACRRECTVHAFDHFRAGLERGCRSFEHWAWNESQRVCEAWSSAQRGYAVRDHIVALRDWLDAYAHFDLPVFADQPEVMRFVRDIVR